MQFKRRILARTFAVILILTGVGCDNPNAPGRGNDRSKTPLTDAERQKMLDKVKQSISEARKLEPPAPKITLATPPGWTRSPLRALPADDNGFSVGYDHDSGLTVTLYQLTRGLKSIPDDVNSRVLDDEMIRAKSGIEQGIQLGFYESANEQESRIIPLGDSEQKSRWCRYQITVDGGKVTSEIFLWARDNTIFKLRITSRSADTATDQQILRPLLTAFGAKFVKPEN